MGWPKGLSRKNRVPNQQAFMSTDLKQTGNVVIAKEHVEPSKPWPGPSNFETGNWYLYHGKPDIVINEFGHVQKWSVIKFEVVKYTDAIMAVRFEDGSFEAVVNPKFEDFSTVATPRY